MQFVRYVAGVAVGGLLLAQSAGCESKKSSDDEDASAVDAASNPVDGAAADGSEQADGSTGSPTAEEVRQWVADYKTAHPGNGGKDWDINAKTPAEIANDPEAQQLLALCGDDQRPVIPLLAWEYGGADHQWINPEQSALVYCVYIPVNPSTEHWAYDPSTDHVTADVYILFPDENPCRNEFGADQVLLCLGDATNIEIIVDIASFNDGVDAGLSLSEASTDLYLLESGGTRVHLHYDP